jgi:hypothetical protein
MIIFHSLIAMPPKNAPQLGDLPAWVKLCVLLLDNANYLQRSVRSQDPARDVHRFLPEQALQFISSRLLYSFRFDCNASDGSVAVAVVAAAAAVVVAVVAVEDGKHKLAFPASSHLRV